MRGLQLRNHMLQLADDYKVIAELFPLWRKLNVSTFMEFFCGTGKFLKLLGVGGFVASGAEPDTDSTIEAQIDDAFVYPYALSDFKKFEDGQFHAAGMVRIDRAPDTSLEMVVEEGLRISEKVFFYSSLMDGENKVLDLVDTSKMNILVRKYRGVIGVSVLKL